jgi:acetolactate synthase-1/2/3 large subunit
VGRPFICLIAWKQENEFDKHTDLSFGNPDWMELASAFGWTGHKVTDSRDLVGTLEQAFDEAGPSLGVIPIYYRENMKLMERL